MFKSVIRDSIASSHDVLRYLCTYDFGDGVARPSIHLSDPAPDDATAPFIVINDTGGDALETMVSTRKYEGLVTTYTVSVWGDKLPSTLELTRLAWAVHAVFFERGRTMVVPQPWSFVNMQVSPPQSRTDDNGFPGYQLILSIRTKKERSKV